MLSSRQVLDIQAEIEGHARAMGFDFSPIVYEMCSHETISEVAAYGGFPTRYPHWSFGMEFERLSKGYGYGLQKIYEMVINTDPVYAYLLDVNAPVDQKLVIAHVCGHAHFFKQNWMFAPTNRKMLDEMANHGQRVRAHMSRIGTEAVETFIDACLSLEDLIDPNASFHPQPGAAQVLAHEDSEDAPELVSHASQKMRASGYMDPFINPPGWLDEQKQKRLEAARKLERFPPRPERDVLLFLLHYAPLSSWQRDVLSIIREEALYFAPQGRTKILNEGCACYAHTRLMTRHILQPSELIDYAEHHSGTVAAHPGRLNPYRLGLALLDDIERRWDRGQFGRQWEECQDWRERREWNTQAGLGKAKVFEVWQHFNDVTFLDEFLTPEFVAEHLLFGYEWNDQIEAYEVATRDFAAIKAKLLFGLTNHGRPFIFVAEGNFENRGELLLWHRHEGIDLKTDEAQDTLKNLHALWQRPVHLQTRSEDEYALLSFDGKDHKERALKEPIYSAA